MEYFETAITSALDDAAGLIQLMRSSEVKLAETMEPLLFPEGAPKNFTIAEMMRAQARLLARTAQAMAEAEIAYNAVVQKYRQPNPQQTSVISNDAAHRLALSSELETLVLQLAESLEAKVVAKLFPGGLPPDLTLLSFLQSLRGYLEAESLRTRNAPAGDSATLTALLHKTVNTIATIYTGFCDQAEMDDLAEELRNYMSTGE